MIGSAVGIRLLHQIITMKITGISFHYEYASAVMMGLIFLGVKQRDAIKHI